MSFAVVAGLGGTALLVIAYRRQRTTEAEDSRAELAVHREDTRLFTERFTTASEQLGSEHAAVRLAGVHALAHLADDAPEGRDELVQMCIDVLCAYLRMPYEPAPIAPGEDAGPEDVKAYQAEKLAFAGLREVRHTILRIIGDHLRADTRWRGKNFDFNGTIFEGGDLSGVHFSGGRVSFAESHFTGSVFSFSRAEFMGGAVSFAGAQFSGAPVSFSGARFSGAEVDFTLADFAGDTVSFKGTFFDGGVVDFSRAHFSGAEIDFIETHFRGGSVSFSGAQIADGRLGFERAHFSGAKVKFVGVLFVGGSTIFVESVFSGGIVDFSLSLFTHGAVQFLSCKFSGGRVSFVNPKWGETRGECPSGLLSDAAKGLPGTVLLPAAWVGVHRADEPPEAGQPPSFPAM